MYHFFPKGQDSTVEETTPCRELEFHFVVSPEAVIKLGKHTAKTL